MKNFSKLILFVFLFILLLQISSAQIVPSSCEASDSIVKLFEDAADKMALKHIYRNNLGYVDSVIIPQSLSKTFLESLIAVYNAENLNAKDTVINQFNIHPSLNMDMKTLRIVADSNLYWMQELRKGNLETGNSTLDNIIKTYNLTLETYWPYVFEAYHSVKFKTIQNYNMAAIINMVDTITGVYIATTDAINGDGSDIIDSIYSDHIELLYSYGWGDCWSGCILKRFWRFNVYSDCSVEFVESFGDFLPKENNLIDMTLHYNPTYCFENIEYDDTIFVTGNFSNWAKPGTDGSYALVENDEIYSVTIEVFANEIIEYKYWLNSGWEGGEWIGEPNRIICVEDKDTTVYDECDDGCDPTDFYQVNFNFDVSNAPLIWFNPETDSLFLTGGFTGWAEPGQIGSIKLTDENQDLIYSATKHIMWYSEYNYQYYVNAGTNNPEFSDNSKRIIKITNSGKTVNDLYGVSAISETELDIQVNPNPFTDFIKFSGLKGDYKICIYALNGKTVLKTILHERKQLNTSMLEPGFYFIEITDSQNQILVKKIIKN